MTKKLMILAALAPLLIVPEISAQEPTDLADLVRRGELYLSATTFEPFTGPVEGYWAETGQVKERGMLVEGRWDGEHEWYHVNGRLSTRENWSSGRLNGPSESFFKSGQLSVKEQYVNGQLHGPYEAYWNRGWLAERGAWENGQPCGDWLSFGRSVSYPSCRAN